MNPVVLPLLLAQGWWVRRVTPRLPDAAGPIEGRLEGAAPEFNLIIIGESPVAGIGAPTHCQAITGQTALAFHQLSGQTVRWLALGLSRATVQIATQQLVPKLADRQADVVILAFGVNDALKQHSVQQWTADLHRMISKVRRHVGPVPIVLSGVPPLNDFPAFPKQLGIFLGKRSALLNQASSRLAEEIEQVSYAPMIEGLRAADFCADRFHPSVSGYAAWGKYLAKHLNQHITSRRDNPALRAC